MVKLGETEVHWVGKTHQWVDPLTEYGASVVRLMDVVKCGNLWNETITKICIYNQCLRIYFMKKMIHFVNNVKVDRRPSLDDIHLALHFVEFHSC